MAGLPAALSLTLDVTRAVLPHMRRGKTGRIINISSIAGKMATTVNGAYSATKFALEAISDALRLELAPFWHSRRAGRAVGDQDQF